MSSPTIAPATLERLLQEGRRLWDEFGVVAANRDHLFVPCDHRAVCEALRPLSRNAFNFLEFGSAAGVVTIMADLLGMDAYGIEIEPWLVQQSIELAMDFGSEATFAEGSFVPFDYRNEIEHLCGDRLTPTEGADAFDEIYQSS